MSDSERKEERGKTDLRVAKTIESLDDAMQSLLREKDFDSITVKEICDRARTRSATFYNYFSGKADLLAYVFRQRLEASVSEGIVVDDPDEPSAYYCDALMRVMEFMDENETMFHQVMRSGDYFSSGLFRKEAQAVLLEKFERDRAEEKANVYLPDLLADMAVETMTRCAEYWLKHRDEVTKEETVRQFKAIADSFFEA